MVMILVNHTSRLEYIIKHYNLYKLGIRGLFGKLMDFFVFCMNILKKDIFTNNTFWYA